MFKDAAQKNVAEELDVDTNNSARQYITKRHRIHDQELAAMDHRGLVERVKMLEGEIKGLKVVEEKMKRFDARLEELTVTNNSNSNDIEQEELRENKSDKNRIKDEDEDEDDCNKSDGIENGNINTSPLPGRKAIGHRKFSTRSIRRLSHNNVCNRLIGVSRFSLSIKDGKERTLPENTHSFMICSEVISAPFLLGVLVFVVQFVLLMLLFEDLGSFMDLIQPDIPVNGKILQYVSTTIVLFTQDDFRLALTQIHEGFDQNIGKTFIHSRAWKWYLVSVLRLSIGAMGIVASFFLILKSATALDVLMNFAAMDIVLQLDNVAFDLSKTGIFGETNIDKTEEIETKTFQKKNKSSLSQIVTFLVLAALLSALAVVNHKQTTNFYVSSDIFVDFADNAVSSFGGYSGFYQIDKSFRKKYSSHVPYFEKRRMNSSDENMKMIAYCSDGYWTLSERSDDNPCGNYLARSGETTTYKIEKTQNTLWTAKSNFLPLDYVVIKDDTVMKNEANNTDTPCPHLQVSKELFRNTSLLRDRSISDISFKQLFDHNRQLIKAYEQPIYVEDFPTISTHQYLLLFTGRRWIVTLTKQIEPLQNITALDEKSIAHITDYFTRGFHIYDLHENAVISISESIVKKIPPENVRWYNVDYSELKNNTELIPKPNLYDENRNAMYCGLCGYEKVVCAYDSRCEEGICKCLYGASGALCQYPFEVDTCVVQKLIASNLTVDFDLYGEALKVPISQDNELGCSYKNWDQRYILSIILHSMSLSSVLRANVNECSFEEIDCNSNDSSIIAISLEDPAGSIPTEMFLLTSLQESVIRMGSLTGSIPAEVALLNNLVKLDFNRNNLKGQIPTEIGFMTKLTFLSLWVNELTGTLPTELGLLTNMEILYLDMNKIAGLIPSELGRMTRLKKLTIDNNNLSGEIPSELGLLTNLSALKINTNSLTGRIPNELYALEESGQLDMQAFGNINLTTDQ